MSPSIGAYIKRRNVKRHENPPIHLAARSVTETLCGRELNWKWELETIDLNDVLSLAKDEYCLRCLWAIERHPEDVLAA